LIIVIAHWTSQRTPSLSEAYIVWDLLSPFIRQDLDKELRAYYLDLTYGLYVQEYRTRRINLRPSIDNRVAFPQNLKKKKKKKKKNNNNNKKKKTKKKNTHT
jgi:predicted transposase YdaD